MIIDAEDKSWKTWLIDLGWQVSYSFAKPRLTKKGHIGCKWQKGNTLTTPIKEQAQDIYQSELIKLEKDYQCKQIALYHVSLMHLTRLKTRCPVCGGDADILTFMICMGGGRPSTSIVCEHCVNPGQHPIENQVGIYYFKEPCFEDNEGEQSFAQLKYIITAEDLRGK